MGWVVVGCGGLWWVVVGWGGVGWGGVEWGGVSVWAAHARRSASDGASTPPGRKWPRTRPLFVTHVLASAPLCHRSGTRSSRGVSSRTRMRRTWRRRRAASTAAGSSGKAGQAAGLGQPAGDANAQAGGWCAPEAPGLHHVGLHTVTTYHRATCQVSLGIRRVGTPGARRVCV